MRFYQDLTNKLIHQEDQYISFIFTTEVNNNSLKLAEIAEYTPESLEYTKLGFIDNHFAGQKESCLLGSKLKKLVRFSWDDLISAQRFTPAERKDLILGSAESISPELKKQVLSIDIRNKI